MCREVQAGMPSTLGLSRTLTPLFACQDRLLISIQENLQNPQPDKALAVHMQILVATKARPSPKGELQNHVKVLFGKHGAHRLKGRGLSELGGRRSEVDPEVGLDLVCSIFKHGRGERWLQTNPERVVHYVVGIG